MNLLEVDDVHVSYGSVHALRGVSIHVKEGEVVGLVGHNGVGKSTLLKALVGWVSPYRGKISVAGAEVRADPARAVALGLGFVPEDRRIFGQLTVRENLLLGATSLSGRDAVSAAVARELKRFPVLEEMFNRRAGDLSGGQQQMLTIARALVSRPKILLLDEPTLGLAPIIVNQIFDTLAELRREGVTMLLAEQNVAKTIKLADRSYVMTTGGRIALEGDRSRLEKLDSFREQYLMVGHDHQVTA